MPNAAASIPAILPLLAAVALGGIQGRIDLLDPSDGGPQPPAGMLVIDFLVEIDNIIPWIDGGLRADAIGGNRLVYNQPDPNAPDLTNPSVDNQFVCSVSVPLPRLAPARFENGHAAILWNNCRGPAQTPSTPLALGVAWFDDRLGACAGRPVVSGAVARVAVELEPQALCEGAVDCCYAIYSPSQVPPGVLHILEANCARSVGGEPPYGFAYGVCLPPPNSSTFYMPWVLAQTPVAGSCRFDLNGDRSIDVSDLSLVLSGFGAFEGEPGFDPTLDFDRDGRVSLRDLATFLSHWGDF